MAEIHTLFENFHTFYFFKLPDKETHWFTFVDLSNPVLITSIVFVGLFAVLSVLDCFLGEDGWYLVDLKQAQDAKHYFGTFLVSTSPARFA